MTLNYSKFYFILFLILTFSIFSCESEDENEVLPPLSIPTVYDATNYTTNTVAEYELRTNFKALIDEVKKGRVANTILSATKLNELFNAGTNSVSKYAPSAVKTQLSSIFTEIEKASKGSVYQFGKEPSVNTNGGVNAGYLFDETGLELEQIIEKTSFNSILFNKVVELSFNPTAENLDKILALYGANPTFPNTPTASNTALPDIWMANYGARRTKSSGGLYTQVRDAFIKAQAAIKAGNQYNKDRDAAIAEILLKWEEMNAATVINYLYDTEKNLAGTNPTEATISSAMHAYGECVGFLSGMKGISKKKISDTQIDNALTKMNYTMPYKLIDSPLEIAKLVQVRNDLKAIYKFTDIQMEEFKNNYITIESR